MAGALRVGARGEAEDGACGRRSPWLWPRLVPRRGPGSDSGEVSAAVDDGAGRLTRIDNAKVRTPLPREGTLEDLAWGNLL